jgi:glutathione S-transferase
MALAHKGLDAKRVAWRFTEKEVIAFSGSELVPVLVSDKHTISDSWRIARYLEDSFPDRPSLFGAESAIPLAEYINAWADGALMPALGRILLLDIHNRLTEEDQIYFRATREKSFGKKLEDVVADRTGHLASLKHVLTPLRKILRTSDYISGAAPAYADYCVFGMFMWARCVSDITLLEPGDPILPWRDRLLDAFDGMARSAVSAQH